MPLRTPEQYRESLRDGRTVYFQGRKVGDVTSHPALKTAVEHGCIDFALAEEPQYKELATVQDPDNGEVTSRLFQIPRSSEDLLKRSELIEAVTKRAATLVVLIKEVGTDALFALHIIAKQMDKKNGTNYLERVRRYHRYCRDNDLAMALAQTDVKGDRSLRPSEQEHPDYYLRVVKEDDKGIVVRGAKVHTTAVVNANELIVLPTRNMNQEDRDYTVAFALPVNTGGLTLVASSHVSNEKNDFEHPISARHRQTETLTIFEDVFVPWERVFMRGEWDFAGELARTFAEFHRFTAISYKLPTLDALVGTAMLMADYNGIDRASHIRDKITWLIAYAETVRYLTRLAALQCLVDETAIAIPNPLIANMAKLHFASNYHRAISHVQDIAGGLLVTAPGREDLANPETAQHIKKYLGGRAGIAAEERLKVIHLIKDITASDFGGYLEVLTLHAEGSIEAEKLTIQRNYDPARAVELAKKVAGINWY